MSTEKNNRTITIGPVRFSYLKCFKAEAIGDGGTPKFSVCAIIPKKDKALVKKIEKAIEEAKLEGKDSKWGGKIPGGLKLPLRDGDEERSDDEVFENTFFMNCHSETRPGVVDASREPITDPEEVYSGAYGYLNVTLYPYNSNGSKGVAVAFNHLMKTKDGERLSGRISVEAAFEGIEIEEEEEETPAPRKRGGSADSLL